MTGAEAQQPGPCTQSILVVDDDGDVRRLLARVCGTYTRHQVVEADGGHAALRALYSAEVPPCVIVLDLMMAGISGYDVIGELRRHRRFMSIPVVLVTAADDIGLVARAHARRVVKKPFARLELMIAVQELCRVSRETSAAEQARASVPPPDGRQSGTWSRPPLASSPSWRPRLSRRP